MSQELNGTLSNNEELIGSLQNEANLIGSFGTGGDGTSDYNDLENKPSINNVTLVGNKTGEELGLVSDSDLADVAFSGDYDDLSNKPSIPAPQVNSDWNATTGVAKILNKPNIPTKISDLQNDSDFVEGDELSEVAFSGSYTDLSNKPTIPNKTSELTNDSDFVEASDLAAVATSGSYNDLSDKPSIPAAQVNSDWNANSGVAEILNKPTIPEDFQEISYATWQSMTPQQRIDAGKVFIPDYPSATPNATEIPMSSNDSTSVADKISEIIDNFTTITGISSSWNSLINQGALYAYSVGKFILITGYLRAPSQINSNVVIGSVTGVTLTQELFISSVGANGTGIRLVVRQNGNVESERVIPANEWFSFTVMGFIN